MTSAFIKTEILCLGASVSLRDMNVSFSSDHPRVDNMNARDHFLSDA